MTDNEELVSGEDTGVSTLNPKPSTFLHCFYSQKVGCETEVNCTKFRFGTGSVHLCHRKFGRTEKWRRLPKRSSSRAKTSSQGSQPSPLYHLPYTFQIPSSLLYNPLNPGHVQIPIPASFCIVFAEKKPAKTGQIATFTESVNVCHRKSRGIEKWWTR